MTHYTQLGMLLVFSLTTLGCGQALDPSTTTTTPTNAPITSTVLADDVAGALTAQSRQLSLTIERLAQVSFGATSFDFSLSGRSDQALGAMSAYMMDKTGQQHSFGQVHQLTAQTFELRASGHDAITALATGNPVFLDITTTAGQTYTGRVVLRPEYTGFQGSRKIWLKQAMVPKYIHNEYGTVTYRSSAYVRTTQLTGGTDFDVDPKIRPAYPGKWYADWASNLPLAMASDADKPIYFFANVRGTSVSKFARVTLATKSVSVTIANPAHVWPHQGCRPNVKKCIQARPAQVDLGMCGSYIQVAACDAFIVPPKESDLYD